MFLLIVQKLYVISISLSLNVKLGLSLCFMCSHVERNYALASSINKIMLIANKINIELLTLISLNFLIII